jgi:hypothetical protein
LPAIVEAREAYAAAIVALSAEQVAVIQPGDVAVIEVERHLTSEQYERLRDKWAELTGAPRPCVIDGGLRLAGVVKPVKS